MLSRFAELVKSPEHIHTYKISPLSIWNAAAVGVSLKDIQATLLEHAKYAIPANVLSEIEHAYSRYGQVELRPGTRPGRLEVEIRDPG